MQFSYDLCDYFFILPLNALPVFYGALFNPRHIGAGNAKLLRNLTLRAGLHSKQSVTQLYHGLLLGF